MRRSHAAGSALFFVLAPANVAGTAAPVAPTAHLVVGGFVVGVPVVSFVRLYEEPTLRARYGDAYRDYCSAVCRAGDRWRRRSASR